MSLNNSYIIIRMSTNRRKHYKVIYSSILVYEHVTFIFAMFMLSLLLVLLLTKSCAVQ